MDFNDRPSMAIQESVRTPDMLMERCRTFRHKEESDITFDTKGS